MMNGDVERDIQEVEQGSIEESSVADAYFRDLLAKICDMEDVAGKIARACAECGITLAEFFEFARSCGVEPEAAAMELLEKGEISAKRRRGPTGFEGKRPPTDIRPRYTAPTIRVCRKKKHGRESGRKL